MGSCEHGYGVLSFIRQGNLDTMSCLRIWRRCVFLDFSLGTHAFLLLFCMPLSRYKSIPMLYIYIYIPAYIPLYCNEVQGWETQISSSEY